MADSVELAFRRAALELIPEGASVLVAVSGGADSVALLHLLHRHARGRSPALAVAHLDHALRPGSAADRRFVERLAKRLDLRCIAERREVRSLRRKDESLEEAARRIRRAFLLEAARTAGAGLVATGHTLDDQAETVLMRMVRGAGPSALAGMAPAGPGPFVRPLLGIERRDLRAWLERRGLPWREDPSNLDLRFDRNRVRRLVVPFLQEALNPRAGLHLAESAGRLREDAAYLDEQARRAWLRHRRRRPGGRLVLPSPWLGKMPRPLARRVARLALEESGADPRRIGARQIEALIKLARGPVGKTLDLHGRLRARRRADRIVLERGEPAR